ncbi:MAG: protein kinase, partial [Candidatus Eisenbacteria bacterium]|nr:protein kinase [Candidatus Eisenbacteria bacterium]
LGPYEISAPLGAGGMGDVYRAHDSRLGRDVAIKVLSTRLTSSDDLRARFEREARTLSQLNHPHICTLHDVGSHEGADYLVMELIEGETLAARLERGPLPIATLLASAVQIAGALAEAHRAGLVHRDLKPANLMMTESGMKLLDFGLAAPALQRPEAGELSQLETVHQPLTAAGMMIGTFQYMAPEQLEGREADERSDLFALGCVLYEMATGRRPFRGNDTITRLGSMLRDRPEAPASLNAAMPRALGEIVARCLERDPALRYANAGELRDALLALQRWPYDEALPELARICERILMMEEGAESWNAFVLAREIEKLAPGDPMLERLRAEFSLPITIMSDPPGAKVTARFYGDPDGERIELGRTPLENVPYPRGVTRLELELTGHRTAHDTVLNLSRTVTNATEADAPTWRYTLHRPGEIPDEMEAVPAGGFPIYMPGLDHLETEPTGAFLMDRHPVTNREYKRFVDDGGYTREEFWREPFVEGERMLPRAEAMARLTDAVGQSGPAKWEMGDYPAGEDDHPVTGVSWYEAAAYAAWAGKTLPTLFHWNRVAMTFSSALIVPFANLSGRGTVAVGSTNSVNRFGVHDLAGNVREWVLNSIGSSDQRYILGGGWNDMGYAFVDAYGQPAFDRSATNGIRCIRELAPDPNRERLARAIEFPTRDFLAEPTVSDDVFGFFLRQFSYDRTPLDARIVAEQPVLAGLWQTIELAAAYGGERMQAHLFLPARGRPPYQTVVLFPGSLALHNRSFTLAEVQRVDWILKSGRALLLPIYKSTYERGDELTSDYPEPTALYKDHVIMWGRDLGRAIDYVETRPDLDAGRIAYFGTSWGGQLGAILPAVEKRIRANVLYVAGFCFQRSLAEVDPVHYVRRVTQPTLMLNGELDFFFPAETSQRPMFELLGTPPEHKRRMTYPRGHTVPKVDLIKETLAWLEKYLGPVE